MIVRFGRYPARTVEQVYAAGTKAEVTYDHVGSTLASKPTHRRPVDDFARATDRLRDWAAHAAIRARVHPERPSIEVGQTVVVVLSLGPLHILAPTRIVTVVDEPDAFGFAYGTLPGHPERGEESFVIRREGDGAVVEIAVDAVGADALTRLAAPVVRLLQRAAMAGYARGLGKDPRRIGRAGS